MIRFLPSPSEPDLIRVALETRWIHRAVLFGLGTSSAHVTYYRASTDGEVVCAETPDLDSAELRRRVLRFR